MTLDPADYEFDVAVTFAGQDREFVHDFVKLLSHDGGIEVFYDEEHDWESWGEDLGEYFHDVYLRRARYAIMFISRQYAQKPWAVHERRSALERAVTQKSAYVLPVRLDDTELPGLRSSIGYLDARRLGLAGLAERARRRLLHSVKDDGGSSREPRSVPRSEAARQLLLAERPAGWEYLLLAAELRRGLADNAELYRDHLVGFAEAGKRLQDASSFAEHLSELSGRVMHLVSQLNTLMQPEVQDSAVGRPGESGDADMIVHLASRWTRLYAAFLHWAREVRGLVVPEHVVPARDCLAKFVLQPIEAYRAFVDGLVIELDAAAAKLKAGERVEIELLLTLEIPPQLSMEFQEKMLDASYG